MNWKKITPVLLSGFVCFVPVVSKAETHTYTYNADTPWETILKNIQEELGSGYMVYSNDGKKEYIGPNSTESTGSEITTKSTTDSATSSTEETPTNQISGTSSTEEPGPTNSSETQSTETSSTEVTPGNTPSTEEPTPVVPADPYQDYVDPNGTLSFSQSIDTYTTESNNQVYTYDYEDDGTYDDATITLNGTGDMIPNILQLGNWMDDGTEVPLNITYEDASGTIHSFESSTNSVIDLSNYGSFKRLIIKAETKGTYHIQGLSLGGTLNSNTYTMKADFTGNGKKVYYQSSKLTSQKIYYNLSNPALKVSDSEVDNEDNLHLYLTSVNGEGSASVKSYRVSLTLPQGLDVVNISPLYFDNADAEISQTNKENGETLININIMPFSSSFKQTEQMELVLQNNSQKEQTISLNAIGLAEFINFPAKQSASNYASVLLKGLPEEESENPDENQGSVESPESPNEPEPVITNDDPEPNESETVNEPVEEEQDPEEVKEPEEIKESEDNVTEEKKNTSSSEKSDTPSVPEKKEVINPINAVPIPTNPIEEEDPLKDELEEKKEKEKKEEEEKKNSGTNATGNIDSSSKDLTSSVMDNTDTLISSVGSDLDKSPVEDVEATTEKEMEIPTEIKKEKAEDIKEKTTEMVKENRGVQVFLIGAGCAVAGIVAIALVLKKMSDEEN